MRSWTDITDVPDYLHRKNVSGFCPHCDQREQEGFDLMAKLQKGEDLTEQEIEDAVNAIEFMMHEGFW